MCSIDTGDYCSIWSETGRIARKEYRCGCCLKTIRPGEAYLVHFHVFEGDAHSEKACFRCWLAREEFAAAPGHMSIPPSSLPDYLNECIGEDPYDPGIRRWRRMLRDIERRAKRAREARSA